jgi:hypothetical protein
MSRSSPTRTFELSQRHLQDSLWLQGMPPGQKRLRFQSAPYCLWKCCSQCKQWHYTGRRFEPHAEQAPAASTERILQRSLETVTSVESLDTGLKSVLMESNKVATPTLSAMSFWFGKKDRVQSNLPLAFLPSKLTRSPWRELISPMMGLGRRSENIGQFFGRYDGGLNECFCNCIEICQFVLKMLNCVGKRGFALNEMDWKDPTTV